MADDVSRHRRVSADELEDLFRGGLFTGRLTRRRFMLSARFTAVLTGTAALAGGCGATRSPPRVQRISPLPAPRQASALSLEEVLAHRRSRREFTHQELSDQEISQLLWAAQGITVDWGGRTSPSAGALYPLELYVVTGDAYGRYRPAEHRLEVLSERDLRPAVSAAALDQPAIRDAPLTVMIAAVYARTVKKYGARGRRYVELEAGHAAQNILLQAVSLGLAAVPMGAFDDGRLAEALPLSPDNAPLYLVAVGHPRPSRQLEH